MTQEVEHARGPAVVRVIELVGVSEESWTDAASRAIARAAKTIRHITGADVVHQTAVIRDGKIVEYHINLKVAFIVEEALDLGREMGSRAGTHPTA